MNYRTMVGKFFSQPLPKIKSVVKQFRAVKTAGDGSIPFAVELEAMNKAQLREALEGPDTEDELAELLEFAKQTSMEEVSSMPADLSSYSRASLLESAASLVHLSEGQLRSLSSQQVAWLTVATLHSLIAKLSIFKDGARLKSELVSKICEYLHPSGALA